MEQQTSVTTTTTGVGYQNNQDLVELTSPIGLSTKSQDSILSASQSLLAVGLGISSESTQASKQVPSSDSPVVSPGKVAGRNTNGTSKYH